MWKLLLTIIAAGVVGSFLVATAEADGTGYKTYRDRMGFGTNGTKLTGLASGDASGVYVVILRSGEVIALH